MSRGAGLPAPRRWLLGRQDARRQPKSARPERQICVPPVSTSQCPRRWWRRLARGHRPLLQPQSSRL